MNRARMKLDLGRWGSVYFTWRALSAVWAAILGCLVWLWHQQQQLWTCLANSKAQAEQIQDLQRRLNQHTGAATNSTNKGE